MDASHEVETRPTSRPLITVVIRPRTLWLGAAILVGLFVLWIVVTRGLSILILLFVAIIFAEGIRPLVRRLESFLPRSVAIVLIYLVLFLVVAGLVWLLTAPLIAQSASLIRNLPRYINHLQQVFTQTEQGLGAHSELSHLLTTARSKVLSAAQALVPTLLNLPLLIGGLIFEIITVLIMAFFWLTTVHGLKGFIVGLLPPDAQKDGDQILTQLGVQLGGYVRGVAINMVIAGILTWGGLALLGVPYAILLGVLAGLVQVIPIVGGYLAAAAGVAVAFLAVGVLKAGETWAFYIIIQQFQASVIQPLVMNRFVQLNPLTVLFSTLLGAAVLGFVGAIIGVPLAVVAQVLTREVLAPALRRAAGSASPRQHS